MNSSSTLMYPSPSQVSQRPPLTLNENRLALYRRFLASSVDAKTLRMPSNSPVYVAGLERGERPIGFWLIVTNRPGAPSAFGALSAMLTSNELLPDPDTPVIAVQAPSGTSTETFFRLCSSSPERRTVRPTGRGSGISGGLSGNMNGAVRDALTPRSPSGGPL